MYKFHTILWLINYVITIQCQIHFPDDDDGIIRNRNDDLLKNLNSVTKGSDEYKRIINEVVAKGILNLTLSIDNVLINEQRTNNKPVNVAVYSPIGIAGALALVLLGSNGITFEELSRVMGLTSELDIENNSQLIHETIGKLLENIQKRNTDLSVDVGTQIKYATAIFVQDDYPIRTIYKTLSEQVYKSEILNLDFKTNPKYAQDIINAWITERTNGKITKLLDELPTPFTRVIICSALYFIGKWETPFFKGLTKKRPFYPNGSRSSDSIMIDMMAHGGSFPYYKDTNLNCEILGFPYKGNKTTMYVIVPKNSNRETLENFEKQITPDDIERLVRNTKYTQTVILFPKMTLETSVDLRSSLERLGAISLFKPNVANLNLISPGFKTNENAFNTNTASNPNPIVFNREEKDTSDILIFSRIGQPVNCTEAIDLKNNQTKCKKIRERRQTETLDGLRQLLNTKPNVENPGLYADKVIHKVFIDITETGTEAAAATAVSLSRGGDIVTFKADVPFIFFIRDEGTKVVLFWGTVYNP